MTRLRNTSCQATAEGYWGCRSRNNNWAMVATGAFYNILKFNDTPAASCEIKDFVAEHIYAVHSIHPGSPVGVLNTTFIILCNARCTGKTQNNTTNACRTTQNKLRCRDIISRLGSPLFLEDAEPSVVRTKAKSPSLWALRAADCKTHFGARV